MTTDAIQEDVSPEEVEQQEQPVLSERELAMQAIQRELDERYGQPTLPSATPVIDEPEEPAAPEVPQEPAPAATPEKVRVKVDGKEEEVTLEELKKGYQKDTVASRRLEEAAVRQRELERREAALQERERQIQAQTATPSPEDEGDDDEDLGAALDALVDGDNDTAKKLLAKVMKKGRTPVATPQIDPDALAAKVEAELEAKLTAKENARAFQEFVAANPVFADPEPDEEGNVLLSPQRVRGDYLFDTLYGPKWQRGEISYREALNNTAEHVEREFAPVTPPPPVPTPSEREQRKAKIDNIPVAHGAKQVAAPKERTPEDAISEMAKWRGQG